jgi:4-hydroxybenzoate polyprenyltransferase
MFATLTKKLSLYGELVAFPHTIFALPFALTGLILASGQHPPDVMTVCWVLLAMVGGRSYAMGLNRLLDATIDSQNPRTKSRTLPAGKLPHWEAWLLTILSLFILVSATSQLPPLCLQLLPLALGVLTLYSYTKRFTALCHLVLGLALGFSASGGWIAVTGDISLSAVLLGLAVAVWVAGFDIIYACQDVAFDREQGLHSIPSALGIRRALILSKILHGLTITLMVLLSLQHPVWSGLWLGTLLMGGFLVWEHQLVSADNLDQIDAAFFTANGKISVGVFASVLLGHSLYWLGLLN